jgi:hypothetical protein
MTPVLASQHFVMIKHLYNELYYFNFNFENIPKMSIAGISIYSQLGFTRSSI